MDHETLLATTFAFASFALVWWQMKFWNDFPKNRPKTAPAPTQALTGMSSVVLDPVAACRPFVRKSVVRLACGFMIWQSLSWSAASGLTRGNNRAHQALAWDASAFV